MSGLQKQVEQAIIETLQDPDGAGSDCWAEVVDDTWMEVRGNIDIPHLASHVLGALGQGLDYEYASRYIPHFEDPDFYFQSKWGSYAEALENQKLANDGHTFIYRRLKTGMEEQVG